MALTVRLIDVDSHNFPNIALMKLSAWHKAQGDSVDWYRPLLEPEQPDIVYMSKVFSFTPDYPYAINAKRIVKGGTGYHISLNDRGREVYDKTNDEPLPNVVESMFPDYSIYPQYDYAVSMTSRGCPRCCPFCHVSKKEGRFSVKVADVSDYWNGQKHIEVLDPNITACRDKRELFRQYRETNATICFNQGLDIRLLNGDDIEDINHIRIKDLHFAWDNPKDDLEQKFKDFAKGFRRKSNIGMVYVLTNFNSTMEENLHRIYVLRDLGFDPYVMVYDKPNAPQEIRDLQRWCNNKIIFKSCKNFSDYERRA